MHLNECFENESALSAVECIASGWLIKSKTIFYIPEEAYAGYTYLYDESDSQSPQGMGLNNIARQQQQISSNTVAHHRRHAFVHAKEVNTLHQHYRHYNHLQNRSIMMHDNDHVDEKLPYVNNVTSTVIPPSVNCHTSFTETLISQQQLTAPITVPYMHPELQLPIPPLHLPWFFGALCFSFTLGGIMKLYWTPMWTKRGGDSVNGKYQRHWFPYRTFAWMLILLQGPCSFFADYMHMSNVSLWHIVDRWLACTNLTFHLGELICIYRFTRPCIYASYIACTAAAVVSFLNSQHAQSALDTEGFIFWHNCWHCFPITLIFVCWYENVLNRRWGEYYPFKNDDNESIKRGECGGVLLSEIAMSSKNNLRRSRRIAGKQPELS